MDNPAGCTRVCRSRTDSHLHNFGSHLRFSLNHCRLLRELHGFGFHIAVTERIILYFVGDFTIQATPAAATVRAGQSAEFQIAITPSGDFSAPIALSCSGLPALTTCVFSPSMLPTGQQNASLTIQTVGSTESASVLPPRMGGATAIFAGLIVWLLPWSSRRRRYFGVLMFAIISSAALLVTGCGGGGGKGTYQISVTAQTTEQSQTSPTPSPLT